MILTLEMKKLKRTGFLPAIFLGSLFACAFPLANTALRPELFVQQKLPATEILLNTNGQMLSMVNLLLTVLGACILYHTEFSGSGIKKMNTLPVSQNLLFFHKTLLLLLGLAAAVLLESCCLGFCAVHWFPSEEMLPLHLAQHTGYAFFLLVPAALLMMLIALSFENMWVTLGVGVICIFVSTMIPTDTAILGYFPFVLPFWRFFDIQDKETLLLSLCICLAEILVLMFVEILLQKLRRKLS